MSARGPNFIKTFCPAIGSPSINWLTERFRMPVFSFACPHCAAPLRLKDRHWIGRTIDCPDCGQPVAIREDSVSGVVGRRAARSASTHDAKERRTAHDENAGPTGARRRLAGWLRAVTSPLAVAWIVAAGLSVGLIGWLVGSPVAQTWQTSDASTNEPLAQPAADNNTLPNAGEEGLLPDRGDGHSPSEQGQPEGGPREAASELGAAPVSDDASVPDGSLADQQPDRAPPTAGPLPGDAPPIAPVAVPPGDPDPNGPPAASPFGVAGIAPESAGPADQPIEVPLFDEPPGVDIVAALKQPIARFDQSTPVSARQLLRSLEEMAAVEIETLDLPAEAQSRLDRPVRLTLVQTTVGEILAAVLGQLDLAYEVRKDRIGVRIPAAD